MESRFETLVMEDLEVGPVYDLLTATIAPRAIGFISTVSAIGAPNLAPFSFFTLGGANPPSLVFSAVIHVDGSMKETFKNIFETGEFVVNTVHREMIDGVGRAAAPHGSDLPKWERSGFTQAPSLRVRPPRVEESLAQFECKLFQVVEHGDGPGAARYVIGEVIVAHVASDLFRHGKIAPDLMLPIARMGGKVYVDTAELVLFEPEPL